MNHQPYESWILDDIDLSKQEKNDLKEHTKKCSECKDLSENWQKASSDLKTVQMVSPDSGFTQRWVKSLAERKRIAQKQKALKLFYILLAVSLITFIGLMFAYYRTFSPIELLNSLVHTFMQLMIRYSVIKQTLIPFINSFPLYVTVVGWILLSSGFLLLVLSWLVFVWRINTQGVYIQ